MARGFLFIAIPQETTGRISDRAVPYLVFRVTCLMLFSQIQAQLNRTTVQTHVAVVHPARRDAINIFLSSVCLPYHISHSDLFKHLESDSTDVPCFTKTCSGSNALWGEVLSWTCLWFQYPAIFESGCRSRSLVYCSRWRTGDFFFTTDCLRLLGHAVGNDLK